MKRSAPRTTVALLLALLASLTACAGYGKPTAAVGTLPVDAANPTIAFLMPDRASTRYERYDHPLFEAKVDALCIRCNVVYGNAEAKVDLQREQAGAALAQGADVIVLDAVDSAAAVGIVEAARARGVPVVAYDRPVPDIPVDFYVSFDNEAIGSLIARSLLEKLKSDGAEGGILQVNGSPTDAAAAQVKRGVHAVIDSSDVPLLAEFDTPEWDPTRAQEWVRSQIEEFGPEIAGVVAANDGTGGGAIAAFKDAGLEPVPVTGNDSELAAAQRIIAGEQYNTISKPIKLVAEAAAAAAVQLVHGQRPSGTGTLFGAPSELFTPTVVTVGNLKEALIETGELEASTVCTPEYARACRQAGL